MSTEEINDRLIDKALAAYCQDAGFTSAWAPIRDAFEAGWNSQAEQLKKELDAGERNVTHLQELEAELREERQFSASTVDDLVAARAECARLTEERDELLAVCNALIARYAWYQDAGLYGDIFEMARTAVAKIKEQAPA